MKKTYLFPGQGSQRKGMGGELFDEFPALVKKADKILGYSIKELCLENPDQKLNQTQYTQPALYVVNALSYEKKLKDGEKEPDFVAGHSLGEYNALLAAGVFSFESGLRLVKKRGELMSEAKNGGMAAILNSSEEQIQEILKDAKLSTIDIANLNASSQIVISGLREDINSAQPFFEKADVMFIPLNTSGAFHSRYMKEAADEFGKFIKKKRFNKSKIDVIANVTGKPYDQSNTSQHLVDQLFNSVRWSESMTYLLQQEDMEFEELGVGDVLTKLTGYIKKDFAKTQGQSVEKKEVATPTASNETKEPAKKEEPKTQVAKGNISSGATKLVAQWNETNPIGTKVISDFYENELETRSQATILFGHRAAVYMKGYNGYFDLREVKLAQK
ncbi:Polyketide biosynthesis malonyl CoA-acyl carrier protein transacylase PksC [Kordia antarctica]|uniref:[acyl-carrier-protein] S-malonyltransferase n=1 Tax=Kordia antarctica TaxID=1218801 RepID=A0A7L4ZHZ4_9FLAO|nr:ACP S-malonyltransferase [Kordia antarctica]QHI36087.1 Polyketide biosynthesis malonyl CoA-acyl carrier protein transacylase PksC [Kordia antarctica]